MTTHEGAFDAYAQALASTDRGLDLLHAAMGLRDTWDGTPIIAQAQRWSHGQLAALAWVNARMHSGHIGMFRLAVGTPPDRDVERERNADVIHRAMFGPFSATVELGAHGAPGTRDRLPPGAGDGRLRWDASVRATVWRPGGARGEVTLPPNEVPLEVGATLASRTAMHLIEDGAVARWPYDDDEIHVLVVREIARNAQALRIDY